MVFNMKVVVCLLGALVAIAVASKGPLQVKVQRGMPLPARRLQNVTTSHFKELLPDLVTVLNYDLQLTPVLEPVQDFEVSKVYGKVVIKVTPAHADQPVTEIKLNAFNIPITSEQVSLTDPVETILQTTTVQTGEIVTVSITTGSLQHTVEYDLTIEFVSNIFNTPETEPTNPNHLYGIYRSEFTNTANVVSPMATTQMEPTGAREAFPCFDEPRFKAPFTVTIGHAPENTAWANGALSVTTVPQATIENLLPEGWVWSIFEPTPKMSAYLFALVVARSDDYDCVIPANPDGIIDVQVCGPVHLVNPVAQGGRDGGAYGAQQSVELLQYFATYTDIPYDMNKMYSVAIPDFDAGAMENFGLNTYRLPFLLNFPGESTASSRQLTTQILAHELIHQWFGNLVTCSFWRHIWLNEGFANYFEYVGIANIEAGEGFESLDYRQFDVTQYGLEFDASAGSHPVVNHAAADGSYDDFGAVFSPISYQKAGSLLRMLEEFVTPEHFVTALKAFLVMHHDVASQNDLFASFDAVLQPYPELLAPYTSVAQIMNTWTLQNGFPLVRVSKVANSRVYVSQERYREGIVNYSPEDEGTLNAYELWTIPLRLLTPSVDQPLHKEWFDKGIGMKSVAIDASQWVLANPDGNGFYRTLYDNTLHTALVNQLLADHRVFPAVASSQLLDDYFTFANAEFATIEEALDLTKYLGAETSSVVWHSALYHIADMYSKLLGSATAYQPFSAYMADKLDGALTLIGYELLPDDTSSEQVLKSVLIDWACALGLAQCTDYATREFDEWVDEATKIDVDVRSTLLCKAVSIDDVRYTRVLTVHYPAAILAEDKERLVNALGCTSNPVNIQALLALVHEEGNTIAAEHRSVLLSALAANTVEGRTATVTYFLSQVQAIITNVAPSGVLDLYETLANFVILETDIVQLETTADAPELITVRDQLLRQIATMRANIVWRTNNEERLAAWFTAANTPTPPQKASKPRFFYQLS